MKTVGLIGHYIRNKEKVGSPEKFCEEKESLATVKQVQSFIDNMPDYRDESLISMMARQFTGLKMSNILSTHPEGFGIIVGFRFFVTLKSF